MVRLRILFLLGWIIAAAVAVLTLPPLKASGGGGLRGSVPNDSPAIAAEIDSVERFGFRLLSRTVVVQRDPDGLSPLAQARVLLRSVAITQGRYPGLRQIAGALPLMNTLLLFPSSSEAGTTAITFAHPRALPTAFIAPSHPDRTMVVMSSDGRSERCVEGSASSR